MIFDTLAPMAVIRVELCNWSVMDWEQFRQQYAEFNNPTKLSRFIHVQAPAIDFHLKRGHPYECVFKMNDGWFVRREFNTRSEEPLDTQSCKAFILARHFVKSKGSNQIFVVFIKSIENGFERIWGGWIQSYGCTLLTPGHEDYAVKIKSTRNARADMITERYGADWHNSLVLHSETFRIG